MVRRLGRGLGSWFAVLLRGTLLAVFLAYPVYLVLTHFAVFEPYLYPLHLLQGNIRRVDGQVIVGPYPEFGTLEDLKRRGVRAVISLLNPGLLYERSLLEREAGYERSLGLRFINVPLDSSEPPGSPGNAAGLRRVLADLRRLRGEQVYIHCYLGRHRVGYVAAMLMRSTGRGRMQREPVMPGKAIAVEHIAGEAGVRRPPGQ